MKTDYMSKAYAFMEEHLNEHRREHIKGVIQTAVNLAKIYGEDPEKARTAAALHDIAKYLDVEESDREVTRYHLDEEFLGNINLAHGRIAAEWAREIYGIEDEDILNAIRYHTSSRAGSSLLEKIIFVADTVEPGRTYAEAGELLKQASYDLMGVYKYIILWMIEDLKVKGRYPGKDTINAYKEITDGK